MRLQSVALAQFKVAGAVPVVPTINPAVVENGSTRGGTFFVDGIYARGAFLGGGVTLEYGGGAYRFDNVTFELPVRIHLVGAAQNSADFLNAFGLIGCHASPPTPHNAPNPAIPKIPETMEANLGFKGNLVSAVGQK